MGAGQRRLAGFVRPGKRLRKGLPAVWLNIGWYKHDEIKDEYRRFAGHWVTLVGYGKDERGHEDPDVLIIHDPAPRSGPRLSHDYVRLKKLKYGWLLRGKKRRPVPASDFYEMGGGLKIKEGADAGILEGAIVLRML